MKESLTDEQLDRFMRTLVSEARADQTTVSEIADSRATWWAIQHRIGERKDAAVSPWPPRPKLWRWFMIGAPVTAAVLLAISFIAFRPATDVGTEGNVVAAANDVPVNTVGIETEERPAAIVGPDRIEPVVARNRRAAKPTAKRTKPTNVKSVKRPVEIKTEFIALTYARSPDSGQIVRVKVPSSMMVQLGLVSSVEKPSSLVNAEVIVGDDGLTHAIRFIK